MNKSFADDKKKLFSLNTKLENLHLALQFEIWKENCILGVSVCDHLDLFQRWKTFADNIKSSSRTKLFFASVDIVRCYDTLSQKYLLNVVPSVLKDSSYLVRYFVKMRFNDSITKVFSKLCTEGVDCENFIDFIDHSMKDGRIRGNNVVFIYQSQRYVHTEDLLTIFDQHVSHAIGRVRNMFLHQKTGELFLFL